MRHYKAVRKHVCVEELDAAVAWGKAQSQLVERNGHDWDEWGCG